MKGIKYSTLLFDLDNTLLDFDAAEAIALPKVFEEIAPDKKEKALEIYVSINKKLWKSYEKGEMSLAQILNMRFEETMAAFGMRVDGAKWEERYHCLLREEVQLMDGAEEVLRRLHLEKRIYIVTNGMSSMQRYRLEKAGLMQYIDGLFTSEEIGYQKPSLEFFTYVADHIPAFQKPETLIIGDSPYTDIKGGKQFGIDTCCLVRGEPVHEEICNDKVLQSTYRISKLTELHAIV